MREKWAGDGKYALPLRQVEPYRLWFEFLKLALTDSDLDVDRDFYKEWGDVEGQTFNEWWGGSTWRTLFAIDNEVRLLDETSDTINSNSQTSIDVRIPLGKPIKDSLEDVRSLLEEHGVSQRLDSAPKGKFYLQPDNLDKGFLKQMRNARMYLRLYGFWLSYRNETNDYGKTKGDRTQLAALDWYDWATERNNEIETKGWNYEKVFIPTCMENWCGYLMEPNLPKWGETRMIQGEEKSPFAPETSRRQVIRYIRKARNIARNVSEGVFPGYYED